MKEEGLGGVERCKAESEGISLKVSRWRGEEKEKGRREDTDQFG